MMLIVDLNTIWLIEFGGGICVTEIGLVIDSCHRRSRGSRWPRRCIRVSLEDVAGSPPPGEEDGGITRAPDESVEAVDIVPNLQDLVGRWSLFVLPSHQSCRMTHLTCSRGGWGGRRTPGWGGGGVCPQTHSKRCLFLRVSLH